MLFWQEIQKVRGNVDKNKGHTYARLRWKSKELDFLVNSLTFCDAYKIWMSILFYLPRTFPYLMKAA